MGQLGRDQMLQLGGELMQPLAWKIETENFDRDQPIALRIERSEHGAQRSDTDLVENTKRAERVGRR